MRTTVYQDMQRLGSHSAESLANIEAVVVLLDLRRDEEVVGYLYGEYKTALMRGGYRRWNGTRDSAATAVVHLIRSTALATASSSSSSSRRNWCASWSATRTCSRAAAEVTVLFSDLAASPPVENGSGPQDTCRLVRDMMERLSRADRRARRRHRRLRRRRHPGHVERARRAGRPCACACRAALAMLGEMPALNDRWGLAGGPLRSASASTPARPRSATPAAAASSSTARTANGQPRQPGAGRDQEARPALLHDGLDPGPAPGRLRHPPAGPGADARRCRGRGPLRTAPPPSNTGDRRDTYEQALADTRAASGARPVRPSAVADAL